MLGTLIKFVTGGGLSGIASELRLAYKDKLDAQNDEDRIRAEVSIEQLQARQAVLVAEQSNGLTRWIRPAFALPIVVYVNKIIIWDKVLGLGATDPLDERMWWLMTVVVGAYFLVRPFEKRRG